MCASMVAGRPANRIQSPRADGHWDVWVMDSDGSSPRQLTTDPGDENARRGLATASGSTSRQTVAVGRDIWRRRCREDRSSA